MKKSIKVAISQRICPDFRVPVFRELANRKGINLTVFFGKGLPSGASRNAETIGGFKFKKLFTISFYFHDNSVEKYRVLHPLLPLYLLLGGFEVVIVEPSTNFFNDILTFPFCKILRKKFIWYEAGFPKQPSLYRRMINPFVKMMILGADAYITYNSRADRDLTDMGISPKKIYRAQNTLDINQLKKDVLKYRPLVSNLKSDLALGDAKVALFIGGIEKRKRIENLVLAASILRGQGLDVKVLIIGDGPHTNELRIQLSEEQQKYTVFAGRHVEDAVLYILASDCLVLPGQGGLSINHGLACGKPVIATPEGVAGGATIYDYLQNSKNGFVVNSNDPQALANKMGLLFRDESLYKKLCKGALETAQELTLEKMVNGIEKAIRYTVS